MGRSTGLGLFCACTETEGKGAATLFSRSPWHRGLEDCSAIPMQVLILDNRTEVAAPAYKVHDAV